MEVFWQDDGRAGALGIARRRRGTWFDPALVDALAAIEDDTAFWASLDAAAVTAVEPADRVLVADDEGLDRIAEAFARVVDAKSPYTGRHSEGVAEIAVALGARLDLDADDLRTLRRAGLLHDLGKLAISNRILDKPDKLTEEEWAVVRAHPALSERILAGVPAFATIARIAGNHHEKLDGTGYPRGRTGLALDPLSRILCVADIVEALSAERPYRGPLDPATVLEIMGRDAGTKIDTTVFRALAAYLPERRAAPAAAAASAPSALLGHPLDRGQPRFPRRGEVGEIARGGVEALGPHGVADLAAPAPGLDEPGAVEDREVLDDGGAADRQLAGERRRGAVAPLGEQRQHAPARGVRQRGEDLRRGRRGHGRAATSDRAYSARSRISSSHPSPLPFALRSCSSAGTSSAANPLSTTRSSVPRASGSRKNSTRVEAPSSGSASMRDAHR